MKAPRYDTRKFKYLYRNTALFNAYIFVNKPTDYICINKLTHSLFLEVKNFDKVQHDITYVYKVLSDY